MTDLLVIVPSRSRPQNAHALNAALDETGAMCSLVFAVDEDDPTWTEYPPNIRLGPAGGKGMTAALNRVALEAADDHFALAFMGDDHVPRTHGWDSAAVEALRAMGSGFVYGDDLIQRANLPTAVFVTTDIVRSLGWMAPPWCDHLWIDNTWLQLGRAADCIRYLPKIVIEHMHPIAGKASSDDGYARVNGRDVWDHDERAYDAWRRSEAFDADVAKVRALRQEAE